MVLVYLNVCMQKNANGSISISLEKTVKKQKINQQKRHSSKWAKVHIFQRETQRAGKPMDVCSAPSATGQSKFTLRSPHRTSKVANVDES